MFPFWVDLEVAPLMQLMVLFAASLSWWLGRISGSGHGI